MKHRGWILLLSALLLAGCTAPAPTPTTASTPAAAHESAAPADFVMTDADFLRTDGTDIINGRGEKVYLRGTNAGGLYVQEEWMCPTSAYTQTELINTLDRRFGEEERRRLLHVYEDAFWTEEDFAFCRDMGMTAIRLPLGWWHLDTEEGWDRLDAFIEGCERHGLYVIPDLHGAPGSQNGDHHSGSEEAILFTDEASMNATVALWEAIAARYRGNPVIAAYDLLNEPTGGEGGRTGKVQFEFFDRLYKAIRAIDPDHIIIMESCWEASHLPHPSDYGWENVAYEFHHYDWDNVDNAMAQKFNLSLKVMQIQGRRFGVPILIGEFTCFEEWEAWEHALKTYNDAGFHWTTWTYQVTTRSSWGIWNLAANNPDVNFYTAEMLEDAWRSMQKDRWINTDVYNAILPHLPGNSALAQ